MTESFDAGAVAELGWRQGALLGPVLSKLAFEHAPAVVAETRGDRLIVTSHDCDVVNVSLHKEPVVEVLRSTVLERATADKQHASGRNPRSLQLEVKMDQTVVLSCKVHDRWCIPRSLLLEEPPAQHLPDKARRLVAEWLAKRYIRAAFPGAFDARWRSKLREWQKLLKKHSDWIQGVYLRLSSLAELPSDQPYKCHLIVAVPHAMHGGRSWAAKRAELESAVEAFWRSFEPDIMCAGVEVFSTDALTLADIEPYQRFDADWVSFEDETALTPATADMTS